MELNSEQAYEYMAEHHPQVYTYARPDILRQAVYRKGLWEKGQDTISSEKLDEFASVWRAKGANGGVGRKNKIVIKPEKEHNPKRKWASVEEMIAHFAGTGNALEVPRGVISLKEMDDVSVHDEQRGQALADDG